MFKRPIPQMTKTGIRANDNMIRPPKKERSGPCCRGFKMFPHLSKKEVAVEGYVLAADHQVETRAGFGRKVPAVTWRGFC